MKTTRRTFLKTSVGVSLAAAGTGRLAAAARPDLAALERILAEPVLQRDLLKAPVKIEKLELLRNGSKFLFRVRSTDGAESITVPNNSRLLDVYPMFLKRIMPFFVGKDARDLLEPVAVGIRLDDRQDIRLSGPLLQGPEILEKAVRTELDP